MNDLEELCWFFLYISEGEGWIEGGVNIPILVACVVGSFLTVAGTVVVTTLVFNGCGSCGK